MNGQTEYQPPSKSPMAIVGPAVVERRGGTRFAVAGVVRTIDGQGRPALRFESVLREPFEVPLDDWHLGFDDSGDREVGFVIDSIEGDLTVRGLRESDASWLSSTRLYRLPVAGLSTLIRVIHEVETEQEEDGPWQPFDPEADEPVEFLLAFVSRLTGGVFGLAYKADLTDTRDYSDDPMLMWRVGSRWQMTWPVGTHRWRRDAPVEGVLESGQGEAWFVRRIHPSCSERFLEAFDSGQWISADAVYAASLGSDDDCHISDFSETLAGRLAEHRRDEDDDHNVVMNAFLEGRGMLLGEHLLDDLLAIDAREGLLDRDGPTGEEWIAAVRIDGERGEWGDDVRWRLDLQRTTGPMSHDHWWPVMADEPNGSPMQVFRDRNGRVCRLVVNGVGELGHAVEELGLDYNVFGSPTLWGAPLRGWAWRFTDVEDPFPFSRRRGEGGER